MNRKQKKMLARILTAAAMLIALKLIPVTGVLQLALYLVAYLVIGYDILKKAWRGILNRQVFDENFLMAVATVGAFALAIVSRSGDCFIRSASCFRATPSARAAATSAR